ncbi:FAD-dependent hydroxylase [Synechococcus sp. OH2]|uniref:FAD-dependent hydroxylase n=1 Tax=Synechococcus sp. OH2 TaxID=136798 RepID=UPI0039C12E13
MTILAPPPDTLDALYDVIIVGGGIAGLTLACALQGSGLRLALIEAQSAEAVRQRPLAYALSPLSIRIFRAIGVWEALASHITPFAQVILTDANAPQQVTFRPEDVGETAVFYCGEHGWLQQVLQERVAADPQITCYYEARVERVIYGKAAAEVELETTQGWRRLAAALVVAADGLRSQVRQGAGIPSDGWDYWQSCITALVAPAQDHQNIAYERFWPAGPFAILPLPGNRCQVVWILPHEQAKATLALPQADFLAEMQRYYGPQGGGLTLLNSPQLFPARLRQSRRYYQHRLALVGDAAHHCHPVAGQGLNLGIRDAAALAQVLLEAYRRHEDLGDVKVLCRYGRRRRWENWLVLLFTDLLTRTFSNSYWPLVVLRRLVLQGMILFPPLRRFLLRLMTGLWGSSPYSPSSSLAF